MNKLTSSKNDTVTLNVKIQRELDRQLKVLREAARLEGQKFNVTDQVTEFLTRTINKMEKDGVFTKKTLKEAEKIVKEKEEKKKDKNK